MESAKAFTTRELVHNAAHWLVATPRRRLMPEFGLGSSPANTKYKAPSRVPDKDTYTEEAAVCVVSCVIERLLDYEEGGSEGAINEYSLGCDGHLSLRVLWALARRRGAFSVLRRVFGKTATRASAAFVLRAVRRQGHETLERKREWLEHDERRERELQEERKRAGALSPVW